jgi:hypothetical protein
VGIALFSRFQIYIKTALTIDFFVNEVYNMASVNLAQCKILSPIVFIISNYFDVSIMLKDYILLRLPKDRHNAPNNISEV